MHKYKLLSKKGEGTFSEVLKATSIKSGKPVAIKCMKNHFDSLEQVNNLREIQALHRLSPHPNIIRLIEVLYDQPTGRLALVFELMDMNVYELIRGRRHYVPEDRITVYMYQLMKSIDHMHRNGIFHRDIKPENILLCDDVLKLADFGSCRGIYSKQPYTEYISTRWYRAPECLLTDGYYNHKMDMWGIGCVFFEVVSLFPLFPGTNELDQVAKIHNIIGTPSPELLAKFKQRSAHMDLNFVPKQGTGIAKLIPHASPECIDLIQRLLDYDPDARLSARAALRHPYFRELREQDKRMQAQMLAAAQQPPEQPLRVSTTMAHRPSGGDETASGAAERSQLQPAGPGSGTHQAPSQRQQSGVSGISATGPVSAHAGHHTQVQQHNGGLHAELSSQKLHAEASSSSIRRSVAPHRVATTLPPVRKAAVPAPPQPPQVQQQVNIALRGKGAAPVVGQPHVHVQSHVNAAAKTVMSTGGAPLARAGHGPIAGVAAALPRYNSSVASAQQQHQPQPLRREASRTKLAAASAATVSGRAGAHGRAQASTYVSPYSQRAIAASKHNE